MRPEGRCSVTVIADRCLSKFETSLISCKYFKFEKKILHFPSFPRVIYSSILIDKLGSLSSLHTSPEQVFY